MKKIIILIILTISSLGPIYSQIITNRVIDSLRHIVTLEKNDTLKVKLLSNYSSHILYTAPKEALLFAQEGLLLSNTLNYKKGQIMCNMAIGYTKWINGDYAESTEIFLQSLNEAETIKDKTLLVAALGGLASSYRDHGNHREALKYCFKTLKLLNNGPYIKVWTGSVYNAMKMPDSALYYFLPINKSFVRPFYGYTLSEIGRSYHQKNDFSKALYYYKSSIDTLTKSSNIKDLSHAYNGTAKLYSDKGILDSCIYYAKRGLAISQKLSYKKGIYESYLILSEAYEPNNKTEALKNYKLAIEVKDEIFNTLKETRLMSARFAKELEQIALEKEKDTYQDKLRTNILSGSLFTLLVIAFFLFRNNRLKQKSKRKIEKAYTELKATQSQLIQSEKMASLGELTAGIAHEIQNPLNFVNNFSEVSNELIDEMNEELDDGDIEEAKAISVDIKQNLEKINHHGKRADGIVKGMLHHSRSSSGQKEPTDINALADEYLRLAYHGLRAKDKSFNATLKTDFDATMGKIEVIPQDMGRVILNLITNAFYAVNDRKKQKPQGYEPTVSVVTKKRANNIEILVKDNGNGIPKKIIDKIFQPFFTTKPTGQGTGLGLSMSYDIIKAHGGELKVETKEGEGTTFMIIFTNTTTTSI